MSNLERNIYLGVLVLCLGYIVFLKSCQPSPVQCSAPELVKVDTGYIIQEFLSTWEKPEPDTIILPGPVVEKPVPHFIELPGQVVVQKVDTAAILIEYHSKVVYRDTFNTPYASVYLHDTISENRIQARQWSAQLRIPEITRTEQQQAKQRNQVYVGFSVMALPGTIGGDVNLSLKDKRDRFYEVGTGLIGTEQYYKIGTKFKISLKRKQ